MLQLRSLIQVIIVKFGTELRRSKYNYLYQQQNLTILQSYALHCGFQNYFNMTRRVFRSFSFHVS